jgi:hypothetical protein
MGLGTNYIRPMGQPLRRPLSGPDSYEYFLCGNHHPPAETWDNRMLTQTAQTTHACRPPPDNPSNNDYKIVARILAHRVRPVTETHLKSTQYCGVPGNTILDSVATVRDAIAHAENTNNPLCILTLDSKNAFDRIAHSYLFTILHSCGLSPPIHQSNPKIVQWRHCSCADQRPIPIRCGVRQGCPLSMVLYALYNHYSKCWNYVCLGSKEDDLPALSLL